jgi:glyoxylase-like metal-dependent hydrolase (beta-lactamase superfamily II)
VTDTRFSVGAIECQIIDDGSAAYEREMFFPGRSDEEVGEYLDEYRMVTTPYGCLLVRSGDVTVLIDTGLGEMAASFGIPAGKALGSLAAVGVDPADIDVVVISHCHPDHIGGTTKADGDSRSPVFANAEHWFWETEWRSWTSEEALTQFPEIMQGPARLHLPPLEHAGLVRTTSEEREVAPGIHLLAAPGHTPGHAVVAIEAEGRSALYAADTVIHESQFEHVDWVSALEAMPDLVVETRKRILERAARRQSLFVGFHLPRTGHVVADQAGYRLTPT